MQSPLEKMSTKSRLTSHYNSSTNSHSIPYLDLRQELHLHLKKLSISAHFFTSLPLRLNLVVAVDQTVTS